MLLSTRRSLHGIAESLLAGPQHRVNGSIRLQFTAGGFRTGPLGSPDSYLAVRGTTLTVHDGERSEAIPLSGSFAQIAAAAGVDFGPPVGSYPPASGVRSTDQVSLDPDEARAITDAFAAGDSACRILAAAHGPHQPMSPIIWPEHFDLGIVLGDVNYGVSAGDKLLPEPYAYVGPHKPRLGPFWDQPFGAARRMQDIRGAAGVLQFFEQGRAAADQDPTVSNEP